MKKFLLSFMSILFFYYFIIASPILVEPPKTTIMEQLTPTLTWTGETGAGMYFVDISTDPAFGTTLDGLFTNYTTNSSLQIPAGVLQSNTTYDWRVTDAIGTSDTFYFRTVGTPQQEVGHLSDAVNGLVSNNILPASQGNILINRLQQASHQLDLGHNDVAILNMLLFDARVLILRVSNLLSQSNAQSLISNSDAIINIIYNGNKVIPPLSDFNPHSFNLGQNYPNPFNPTTTIEYTVPENSHVILKIYDVLGREVSTLVDKDQEAGTYITMWNASNFASGVYFYRLTAGNNTDIKRMILAK